MCTCYVFFHVITMLWNRLTEDEGGRERDEKERKREQKQRAGNCGNLGRQAVCECVCVCMCICQSVSQSVSVCISVLTRTILLRGRGTHALLPSQHLIYLIL